LAESSRIVSIRGRSSRVPIDQRILTTFKVRDGKVASIAAYTDREEALKTAGLRE
jgi:ketosteroid isomerase-like protein